MMASSTDTSSNSLPAQALSIKPASLTEAIEACTVAIQLGLQVEAVEGMTLWRGRLYEEKQTRIPPAFQTTLYDYVTPSCSSEETAEAFMANEAFLRMVESNGTVPWHPAGRADVTGEEDYQLALAYFRDASDKTIIADYCRLMGRFSQMMKDTVIGVPPVRQETLQAQHQRFTQLSFPLN
jgi:hypothetical protein